MKYSFYNILMGQYCQKFKKTEPLEIKPFLIIVSSNIGNEKCLIQDKFNPEKIFDFEFYSSTWKKFYDKLIKYFKNCDELTKLFSIALTKFLDLIDLIYGREAYAYFLNIAIENAIYASKISQI